MSHSSRLVSASLAFALVLLGACSPSAAPVSQSATDPSNPSAPEGPAAAVAAPAPPSVTSASAPGDAHAGHSHDDHGGATPTTSTSSTTASASAASAAPSQGVTYVCPMHPEVTSATPGVCPKCNMKLVPKK